MSQLTQSNVDYVKTIIDSPSELNNIATKMFADAQFKSNLTNMNTQLKQSLTSANQNFELVNQIISKNTIDKIFSELSADNLKQTCVASDEILTNNVDELNTFVENIESLSDSYNHLANKLNKQCNNKNKLPLLQNKKHQNKEMWYMILGATLVLLLVIVYLYSKK